MQQQQQQQATALGGAGADEDGAEKGANASSEQTMAEAAYDFAGTCDRDMSGCMYA
jgi:hypothetical protein